MTGGVWRRSEAMLTLRDVRPLEDASHWNIAA
jgi:hypothetical protein